MTHRTLFLVAVALLLALHNRIAAAENLLVNPGFETPEVTHSPVPAPLPAVFGDWNGNWSAIVGPENGINPAEGESMLSFIGTLPDLGAGGISCDVGQFVDLSQHENAVHAGLVSAHASALFNRVSFDAQTDTQFGLLIWAYDGPPGDAPKQDRIGWAEESLVTDSDLLSWEPLSTTLAVPPTADRVAVLVIAYENVFADNAPPEFDGHYADSVSLTVEVIPEPSTLVMLVTGVVALLVYGGRKRRQ